jgi:hypothetical protein
MARPSTGHVRSHDAVTCCRASLPACKPRRRPRKVAKMAVLGVFFEHLSTSVNSVAKRDINIRCSSSAIPIVAHLCSLHQRSDATRHAAAPAVHRFVLTPSLIIHDKAGSDSGPKPTYRSMCQRANALRAGKIRGQRNGSTSTRISHNPGSKWTMRAFDLRPHEELLRGFEPGPMRAGRAWDKRLTSS